MKWCRRRRRRESISVGRSLATNDDSIQYHQQHAIVSQTSRRRLRLRSLAACTSKDVSGDDVGKDASDEQEDEEDESFQDHEETVCLQHELRGDIAVFGEDGRLAAFPWIVEIAAKTWFSDARTPRVVHLKQLEQQSAPDQH